MRLGDRYEAVYAVGSGQNSHTFVGRDRATLVQPQCLIKQFTPVGDTALEREAAAERFRKDVEHWAIASQHPQVPDLLAYFERGLHQFLVQQFLAGPHLDQRLQETLGPLDSDEVMAFLRDVLPILHHLHQHRIIHRDIKPTNFRRPPGAAHWWLVDLGASQPLTATRMGSAGTLVGSAAYAAPEQLRGEATFASDLYSLGVVCLHLLTGLQPFDLFDARQGCWRWRSIVPEVPSRLATLIDRLVQPVLRDRLPDVATAMASLDVPLPPSLPLSPPATTAPVPTTTWSAEQTIELSTSIVDAVLLSNTVNLLVLTEAGQMQMRSLSALDTLEQTLQSERPSPSAIAAHPQQAAFVVATRQGVLESWHQAAGEWRHRLFARCDRGITQLCFTADGQTLISADDQGEVHLWDWPGGNLKARWWEHTASITRLAVSDHGTHLASGDTQGRVILWDLHTEEGLRAFRRQPGAIAALDWCVADQALVTAGWDVTLRWRCPHTGRMLYAARAEGFYLPVRSLLPHPTAPLLVSGSQDGQLQCWVLAVSEGGLVLRQAITASLGVPILTLCGLPATAHTAPKILSMSEFGRLQRWSYPV